MEGGPNLRGEVAELRAGVPSVQTRTSGGLLGSLHTDHRHLVITEVAGRIGNGPASAFGTTFSGHVGQPLSHYARTFT